MSPDVDHGGRIEIASIPGGTTARLTLLLGRR
jgi:hypothetical protein